jgi:hypothetical protein
MPTIDRQAIANAEQTQNRKQIMVINKDAAFTTASNTVSTFWDSTGLPGGAGAYTGVAYTGYQITATSAGAAFFQNAPTNHKNFLRKAKLNVGPVPGTLIILDRLLYFPGIDHATLGTTAMVYSPGLPRYTTGDGVMAFLEVTTALNAVAHTVAINYTDSAGNPGNSTSAITPIASSAQRRVPYTGIYFPLATGDKGIRDVASVTVASGGAPTGTSALVLAKPLAEIPLRKLGDSGFFRGETRLLEEEIDLPYLENGACLMFLICNGISVASPILWGTLEAFTGKTA